MVNIIGTFANVMLDIFPAETTLGPNEILTEGVNFFSTWIKRMGGLVAFVGAVKVAIASRTEDERDIMNAALVCASGFMIVEAIADFSMFKISAEYSAEAAEAEFNAITRFIGTWARRVGGAGFLLGGINFAFSTKNNDAGTKVTALKGMVAGATVMGVSTLLSSFI